MKIKINSIIHHSCTIKTKQVYLCEFLCHQQSLNYLGKLQNIIWIIIKCYFKYTFLSMIFSNTELFILSFLAELQVQVTLRTRKCVCAISLFTVCVPGLFQGGQKHCCWPLNPASYEIMDVLLESLALAILFNQLFRKLLHWGLACLYSWQPSVLMIPHFMCQPIAGRI